MTLAKDLPIKRCKICGKEWHYSGMLEMYEISNYCSSLCLMMSGKLKSNRPKT